MPQHVQVGDGVVEFPDGMSQEDIEKALSNYNPPTPVAQPAPVPEAPTSVNAPVQESPMMLQDQQVQAPWMEAKVEAPGMGQAPTEEQKAPWPVDIGGKPVLSQELFMNYQTRNLPLSMRQEIEGAIQRGEYVLPEGKSLNIPQEESFFDPTGGDQNKGKAGMLDSVLLAPELSDVKGMIASTAPTDEKVQIAVANGMEQREPDFYGRPILYSPLTNKEYTVHAGMDLGDVAGTALTIAPIGKIAAAPMKLVQKSPWLVNLFAKAPKGVGVVSAGARGAGVDVALEEAQRQVGGSFDPMAPVVSGGLSATGRAIGSGVEALTKKGYAKTLVDARNGDKAAIEKVSELYRKDPVGMKQAADTLRLKAGALEAPTDLKRDPSDTLNEIVRGRGDLEDLARDMQTNPQVIDALEARGLTDDIPTRAMIDPEDYKALELFDAAGLDAEQLAGLKKASKNIKNIFTNFFKVGTDSVTQSKNIKQFMEGDVQAMEMSADALYKKHTPNIPEDSTALAGDTLDYLKKRYKKTQRPTKKGYKLDPETAKRQKKVKPLTNFEEEVVNSLGVGKQIKAMDLDDPLGVGAKQLVLDVQDAPASYFELERLRQKAGDIMGDTTNNFSSREKGAAKKLYSSLRADQDIAAKKLLDDGKINQQTYDGLMKASDLVKERKVVEDNMMQLFGKQLNKDLAVAKTADKMKATDFERKIEALPTEQAKRDYMAGSFLSMFGNKAGKLNLEKFGDTWAQLEDSPRMIAMMNRYLPKGSVKQIKDIGEITKSVYGTTKEITPGASEKTLNDIVNKKLGLLGSILTKGGIAVGSSAAVQGIQKVPGFGGSGSVALSVGILNTMRDLFAGSPDLLLESAVDIIRSPELKALLKTDLSKKNIKAASKSKKLIIMARQAGIAKDSVELERFLLNSARAERNLQEE